MRALVVLVVLLAGACAKASQVQPSDDVPPSKQAPRPEQSCAAQVCTGDDGGCDMVVLEGVWIWTGQACVEAYDSGCAAVGPDCDSLYPSKADCEAAWSRCLG